jgi:hypothetical protein
MRLVVIPLMLIVIIAMLVTLGVGVLLLVAPRARATPRTAIGMATVMTILAVMAVAATPLVMPTAKLPNQKLLSAAAPGPVGPERQKAGDALMLAVSRLENSACDVRLFEPFAHCRSGLSRRRAAARRSRRTLGGSIHPRRCHHRRCQTRGNGGDQRDGTPKEMGGARQCHGHRRWLSIRLPRGQRRQAMMSVRKQYRGERATSIRSRRRSRRSARRRHRRY